MIRVAIVDDHKIVRHGLRCMLDECTDLRVAADFDRASPAVAAAASGEFDVMLLDLSMPDMNGMDALPLLRAAAPDMKILVLTGLDDALYGALLIKNGASGYMDKLVAPAGIPDAIRSVHLGGTVVSAHTRSALRDARGDEGRTIVHEQLSPREKDVFLRLAKGQRLSRVAEDMGVSVKTASTYRARILAKLHLASNPAMTRYAMANRLIM